MNLRSKVSLLLATAMTVTTVNLPFASATSDSSPEWKTIYTLSGETEVPSNFAGTPEYGGTLSLKTDTDPTYKEYVNFNISTNQSAYVYLKADFDDFDCSDNGRPDDTVEVEVDFKADQLLTNSYNYYQFRFTGNYNYPITINKSGTINLKTTNGNDVGTLGKMPSSWKWDDAIEWARYKFVFTPVRYTIGEDTTDTYKGYKLTDMYVDGVSVLNKELDAYSSTKGESQFIWSSRKKDNTYEAKNSTKCVYFNMPFATKTASERNIAIDNLTVVSYNPSTSEIPDRGAYLKALRNAYGVYSERVAETGQTASLTALLNEINSGMALFADKTAAKEELNKKLSEIESKISKLDPSAEDYKYSFDFETEESKTAFNSITNYALTEKTDVDTYGIGAHYNYPYKSSKLYFDFPEPIDRTASKMQNMYLEIEYDMRTATSNIKNAGLVILGPHDSSSTKYIGGTQYEEGTGDIHAWWRTKSEPIASWELNKWQRFKIIVKLNEDGVPVKSGTTQMYVDGVLRGTFDDYSGTVAEPISEIYGFYMPNGNGTLGIDNIRINVYIADNKPAEKGVLIAKMREFYSLYKSDYKYYSDVEALFNSAEAIYINDTATDTDVESAIDLIAQATAKMERYMEKLLQLGEMIEIPSTATASDNVTIPFMLHYGEQEGDENFKDIFFNGNVRKDFSDVEFVDRFGNKIKSEIISSGNYDFIRDSKLGGNYSILHLSDGTLITTVDGHVAFSEDNANSWNKTAFKGIAGFVDKDENIYYNVTKPRNADGSAVSPADSSIGFTEEEMAAVAIKPGVYKLSAQSGYTDSKLVIDFSDSFIDGAEHSTIPDDEKPPYLAGFTNEVTIDISNMAQDDDGYLYFARYQTEWTGTKLYVSDSTGENFKCVDWRLDKQHNHAIRINRHVYPNEVYVTYDDTKHSPLCQVTTNHAGYDLIKNNSDYDDTDYTQVRKLSTQSFIQVPIPYQNSDYFGYFGIIDEDEEKFYTGENGKVYTTPDNVYGIGYGESNILGGPSLYKTTDKWDQSKYYALVETTHGIRNVVNPVEGILVTGLLSGNYAQTEQLAISYDEGENWTTVFTEGFKYSNGAGNGAMRFFTDYFTPKGADEAQMISSGYTSYSLRSKFGGDNYSALCYVTLDKLAATGDKIFVRTVSTEEKVNEYALKNMKYTDASGNIIDEPIDGGTLMGVTLERVDYSEDDAVLIAAAYDSNKCLTQVKIADVYGSGEYKLGLALSNGGSHKLFMLDDWNVLRPLVVKEYTPKREREDVVVNNNLLTPVFRLKLNEGSGDTVTESVSGKSFKIDGGYEWIDTEIRYGNLLPIQKRSSTALKLDSTASINLGEIEALKNLDFSKDSMTIAFWTNTEVFSQREGYEETDPYHLSDSYGTIRCGNKYSNTAYHVIFQSRGTEKNFEFAMKYNSVFFRGNGITNYGDGYRVPQPLLDTNYYNLYFVTVRGGEEVTIQTYGNDGRSATSDNVLTIGDDANFSLDGDLYIGAPDGEGRGLITKGVADIMIFDRELTYPERLALYHGINYHGAVGLN